MIAFDSADDAFAFAVSLEIAGVESPGTVAAPDGRLHMLGHGVTAYLRGRMEQAA